MKKLLILGLTLLVLAGCKNDGPTPTRPLSGKKLVRITLNNRTESTFVYENERLGLHRYFGFCTETPAEEHFYQHDEKGRVTSIVLKTGMLYAASTAVCDPTQKMVSTAVVFYNDQDRIASVKGPATELYYAYNVSGLPAELTAKYANGLTRRATYEYDSRGNLIRETDFQGGVSTYEYDHNINPFYRMKIGLDQVNPFYVSPNNVVKMKKAGGESRIVYQYDADGFPVSVDEGINDFPFIYHYQ